MVARSPKEAAEVTSKQTESKRFLSPTQKEQAAKFTSFMVGGGIAGKVVSRLAQIPALVRWFNNLKSKPTIEKAADKVEQLTGTRPKITPKPTSKTTKMETALVPKGQAKAPATVKKLPSVKRVDTKTAPKPKTRPKVRDRDKSTGRAIRETTKAGAALAATIMEAQKEADKPTPKAEAKRTPPPPPPVREKKVVAKKKKAKKIKIPAGVLKRKDQMGSRKDTDKKLPEDISWKKGLDPVTVFVEELLDLKRSKKKIDEQMKITERLEKALAFSGGKQRGGMVKRSSSRNTKKYAMNRGGMASVRKPTRA